MRSTTSPTTPSTARSLPAVSHEYWVRGDEGLTYFSVGSDGTIGFWDGEGRRRLAGVFIHLIAQVESACSFSQIHGARL